jgi:hypothetical protein
MDLWWQSSLGIVVAFWSAHPISLWGDNYMLTFANVLNFKPGG